MSETWLIDPEFSPLPSGAVAVWFGETHRYIALPEVLAKEIIADHAQALYVDRLREIAEYARRTTEDAELLRLVEAALDAD